MAIVNKASCPTFSFLFQKSEVDYWSCWYGSIGDHWVDLSSTSHHPVGPSTGQYGWEGVWIISHHRTTPEIFSCLLDWVFRPVLWLGGDKLMVRDQISHLCVVLHWLPLYFLFLTVSCYTPTPGRFVYLRSAYNQWLMLETFHCVISRNIRCHLIERKFCHITANCNSYYMYQMSSNTENMLNIITISPL